MTTPIRIPFSRPTTAPGTLDRLDEALRSGQLSGDGPATARCTAELERVTGCGRALLTSSCTHALEMCALLLDLAPGDEVVVPSFTFVSTANAFSLHGATPRFADIRLDTLNLDERKLEQHINNRTRAIVVVHYAGVACEMDAIKEIADRHGLVVIEDNAHGLFGEYRGRPLGSIGDLGTLSFHETKNLTCGEGGALLVNRPELVTRAEIIREKGTNRTQFFRNEVDKYTWVDVGSSYLLSDLLAAALLAQLDDAPRIQAARTAIWDRYADALSDWAKYNEVQLPEAPLDRQHPAHLFSLLLPDTERRDRFLAHLRSEGILAVFHYLPLHLSPMGARFGGAPGDCPVAESVAGRLARLPLFTDLQPGEQEDVIDAVLRFSC
jgi:dTDP-4-amino-4,6-dideoxygalactose transaminase